MSLPLAISPGDPGHIGDHVEIHDALSSVETGDKVAGVLIGLYSARPAAGNLGRFYYATDADVLFFDTGSGWEAVGASLQTEYALASATQAHTTTATLLAGTQVSISTVLPNSVYEVIGVFNISVVASGYGTAYGRIVVDGSGDVGGAAVSSTVVGEDTTVSTVKQGVLAAAGSHTFALFIGKTQAGGTVNSTLNSSRIAVKVWQGAVS